MSRRRSQPPSFTLDSSFYLSQENVGSSAYSSFSLSSYGQSDPLSSQSSLVKSQPDRPKSEIDLSVEGSEQPHSSAAAANERVDNGTSDTMSNLQRDLLSSANTLAGSTRERTGKAFPDSWTYGHS